MRVIICKIVFQDINCDPVKKIRGSRPEIFCKKDVPKSFTETTGKHLWESLSFNKVAGLRLKKENLAQLFSCEFVKFLREHLWRLLLKNTENTVSRNLYFNEKSDSSEENTCGNEIFRFTIETYSRLSYWFTGANATNSHWRCSAKCHKIHRKLLCQRKHLWILEDF